MTDNDQKSYNKSAPVRLAEHFAASDRFNDLFVYGMDLVEETATFLDTEGRQAAKSLSGKASAVYGTESMRLTTRLMQVASWLLLQRAVAEGEMTVEQAIGEKKNVRLNQLNSKLDSEISQELPENFIDLIERSAALQRRIKRLDEEIYGSVDDGEATQKNPVASQRALLQTAFGMGVGGT